MTAGLNVLSEEHFVGNVFSLSTVFIYYLLLFCFFYIRSLLFNQNVISQRFQNILRYAVNLY